MSSRNETLKIHKPHIILCEGADEYWFLIRLLNSNELADTPFFSESIQVIDFGGNEELHNQLSVLKLTPGFANVESLLIMRDAERNAEGAIKQISASLGKVISSTMC